MQKRPELFRLSEEREQAALEQNDWACLQQAFETNGFSLSQSWLVGKKGWEEDWEEGPENGWILADFGNRIAFSIESLEDEDGLLIKEVSEAPEKAKQLFTLTDTEAIIARLRHSPQGTNEGLIDLLQKLNLDEPNLEVLKRSDLSTFSFEFVHQDLLVVHSMLREILKSSRESLLSLSWDDLQEVSVNLQKFFDWTQQIKSFQIGSSNPREIHDNLLQSISDFCSSVKTFFRPIIPYLSLNRITQLETQVNETVVTAVGKLNAETGKAAKDNAERQQEFEGLKTNMENLLAEETVSQYKAVFSDQAAQHRKWAGRWLVSAGSAGLATIGILLCFFLLPVFEIEDTNKWSSILQNLFTKGFLLSPIFVWLNRSIKNYTAQKHLEVINTHRQNALETFDTFVAAAGDNTETRDAVLLAATGAIFDANHTGYMSTKTTGSDSRNPILHIIRESVFPKSPPKE